MLVYIIAINLWCIKKHAANILVDNIICIRLRFGQLLGSVIQKWYSRWKVSLEKCLLSMSSTVHAITVIHTTGD